MSHLVPTGQPAPPLQIARWLNADPAPSLEQLRGRVVVLHAFQMLCPGCVAHGLPQAKLMQRMFPPQQLALLGLHTVFEHHEVMTAAALEVFAHEYRLTFPIGIDQSSTTGPIPLTMAAYELQGTPSLVLIDRAGCIRMTQLGQIDDLHLGVLLGQLLSES